MPSKHTERRHAWLRGCTEVLLAFVLVAMGWTHGMLFVEGASMEPALSPGDLIVYRRVGVVPKRGDLVVFEHGGTLVVHRVAGQLRDGALRTRGDANRTLDVDPVVSADVRGQVLLVVPAGRLVRRLAGPGD